MSMASTSVVLPWSTWATIATLRRSLRDAVATAVLVVVSDMRNGSIQWSQLLYRDISNRNARQIRPFAQGAFPYSTGSGIYWPKYPAAIRPSCARGIAPPAK
ncbi:hypothetical protein ARTHROSP310_11450 [Arthrobacter sp. AD-310]